ncbi:hydroxymethylpyrimidine/phosphomethylpyrimidine kinase [Mesorhizobium sp. B4-1-4]|nr:hydroxymethylpyrimidine/phosphomethylpyrimidine kinase [Mesorhizobium sp. B4-1-4]
MLSSAIVTSLGQGASLKASVQSAEQYVFDALSDRLDGGLQSRHFNLLVSLC